MLRMDIGLVQAQASSFRKSNGADRQQCGGMALRLSVIMAGTLTLRFPDLGDPCDWGNLYKL